MLDNNKNNIKGMWKILDNRNNIRGIRKILNDITSNGFKRNSLPMFFH